LNTNASHASQLRVISLFEDLQPAELLQVAGLCTMQACEKHAQIMGEQDQTTDVFFILAGSVRISSYTEAGREVIFSEMHAGDIFGEFSAVDRLPRSASIVALSELLGATVRDASGTVRGRVRDIAITPQDHLTHPFLLFAADFDAASGAESERDSYLGELWDTMGDKLREILTYCEGFDAKVTDAASFAKYIASCQIETTMPFNDYWLDGLAVLKTRLPTGPVLWVAAIAGIAVLAWLAALDARRQSVAEQYS